jgi:hypothetical protein
MRYLILALFCSSCLATTSDLRDMADALRKDGKESAAKIVDAKAEEIEERAASMANDLTDPMNLLNIGLAALLGGAGVNFHRNRTRKRALAGLAAKT